MSLQLSGTWSVGHRPRRASPGWCPTSQRQFGMHPMKTAKNIAAASVDEYLNVLPEKVRSTMEKIRKAIKSAAPKAEEVISYQIPTYKSNGPVGGFAAFKNHCSFFTMSDAVMKEFQDELKAYGTSGVTIRFPLDKPLPAALVKKLVVAKMKGNEARLAAKTNNKPAIKKSNSTNSPDVEKVNEYMNKLQHPLKAEMEMLRDIIKNARVKIVERIK